MKIIFTIECDMHNTGTISSRNKRSSYDKPTRLLITIILPRWLILDTGQFTTLIGFLNNNVWCPIRMFRKHIMIRSYSFGSDKDEDVYFAAWTTTPWTLIGNLALAVGSNAEYTKIKLSDTVSFLIASERIAAYHDLLPKHPDGTPNII